jgi:DNA primase
MKIPEHIINRIRQDTDIVELIGDFVALKKRGRNYVGLCPFHSEKTPSFNVLAEKGIFKCFGCGKGGDAITFVREHQKMSYPEALRYLAARLGIEIAEDIAGEGDGGRNRYESAYQALRLAGNFYFKTLYSEEGAPALEYVRRRGFSEEIVKLFALGYAPDSFSATMQELKTVGVSEEALFDAGLIGKKEETGRTYDRFRGRLMFPILNSTGRVVGFAGRTMKDGDKSSPKYLNSPQSLVYNKSEILYGLFHAKDAIRRAESAILVEGYADVLSLYQAGFRNVVASGGTSLTKEQLHALSRYCKRLFIVYDADRAGVGAALRGLDLAIEQEFDVRIVRLPEGDDPDTLIQREGEEVFQRYLDSALSLVDFKGELFREQGLLETPDGKLEAARSMLETIAKAPSAIQRDFMIQSVAMRFAVREEDLYAELTPILRRNRFQEERAARPRNEPSAPTAEPRRQTTVRAEARNAEMQNAERNGEASAELPTTPNSAELVAGDKRLGLLPEEEELLRIALTVENACLYMKNRLGVSSEFFLTSEAKEIFALIDAASANGKPLDELLSRAASGEELTRDITGLAIRAETPSELWKNFQVSIADDAMRAVQDCILRLTVRSLENELLHLQESVKTAERNGEQETTLQLLREIQSLDAKKREALDKLIR